MFEPEEMLKGLKLKRMTDLELLQSIAQIAASSIDGMSPGYYQQRLGAIQILANEAQAWKTRQA